MRQIRRALDDIPQPDGRRVTELERCGGESLRGSESNWCRSNHADCECVGRFAPAVIGSNDGESVSARSQITLWHRIGAGCEIPQQALALQELNSGDAAV